MVPPKPNKHEQKTTETRALLLRAAQQIFVRDGYEGAELGQIAALAGRTKGAIYAQFKSKEDIFLALIEQQTNQRREEFRHLNESAPDIPARLQALRQFAQRMAGDRPWALLLLEFKLYALRHPEARDRLQRFMDLRIPDEREGQLTNLFGPAASDSATGHSAVTRTVAVNTLEPLLSALALEAAFLPRIFTAETLELLVNQIFDALLPPT